MSTPHPWDDARTSARGSGPPQGPNSGPRTPVDSGPGSGPGSGRPDGAASGARDLGWSDIDRKVSTAPYRSPTLVERAGGSKALAGGFAALVVLAVSAFLVISGTQQDADPSGDASASADEPDDPAVSSLPNLEEPPTEERVEDQPAVPPAAPDVQQPLSREPEDRTAFALAIRERTVTVYCLAAQSQGSGWPFRASSLGATAPGAGTLIVTNAHVVDGCEGGEVVIQLGDQRVVGDVVGYDLFETDRGGRDLALVLADIDIEPFDVSTDVEIGNWVMAVGSPSGLDGTVTFGYIANDRDGVLIFDAAISPGNSGGPLVNARGEVIGTNTWLLGEFGSLSMALRVDVLCVRLLECR